MKLASPSRALQCIVTTMVEMNKLQKRTQRPYPLNPIQPSTLIPQLFPLSITSVFICHSFCGKNANGVCPFPHAATNSEGNASSSCGSKQTNDDGNL